MPLKTASDFDPEVMKLFDQYVHGDIDRRTFLNRSTKYAVSGMTAPMLLDALNPKFAEAQQVRKDDARISGKMLNTLRPMATEKCAVIWRCRRSDPASYRACWWCTRIAD